MINLKEIYKLQQDIKDIQSGGGIVGPEGKSAYQVAVDNGFIGTIDDWLRSLRGEQGIQGIEGKPGQQGLRGPAGASAYDIAVSNGFSGNMEEWLESIKGAIGDPGPVGPKGADGLTTSIQVNGSTYNHVSGKITLPNYPTLASLGALPLTGGTLTGNLISNGNVEINVAGKNFIAPNGYGYVGREANGTAKTMLWMDSNNTINIGKTDQNSIMLGSSNVTVHGNHRVYHQGFKPTASDIGALPLTGGTLTGRLTLTNSSVNPSFGTSVNGDIQADSMQDGLSIIDSGQAANGYRAAYSTVLNVKSSLDRQFQLCINNNGLFSIRVSHSQTSYANKWKPWIDVYTTENKPAWGDINNKPSTFPPTIGTASNQAAAGNHTHNDKANTNLVSSVYKRFEVGGDKDTYYPVLIKPTLTSGFGYHTLNISRAYNWKAPDTWNTSTHRGGLTLSIEWTGDIAWGGNDKEIRVKEFQESYSTMVAGMILSTSGLIVWLRGGGATYQVDGSYGDGYSIGVTLGTLTASDNSTYAPRIDISKVSSEILNRQCLRAAGKVYDSGSRVYSPVNKPTAADIGAAASSHSHSYLPITGGTLTGDLILNQKELRVQGQSIVLNKPVTTGGWARGFVFKSEDNTEKLGSFGMYGAGPDLINMYIGFGPDAHNGSTGLTITASDLKFKNNKVYHAGSKPTAADVGARPSSWVPTWGDITGKPSTFAPSSHTHDVISTKETNDWNTAITSGFWQGNGASNGPEASGWFWGYRMQHGTSGYGAQIAVKNGGDKLYFRHQIADGTGTWREVYHTGKKPTASEIGAAASNHTHESINGTQVTADIYNYANGVLINTNQLSAQSTMVTVRIIGNGYGAGLPIDCTYCFYDYNADSVIMNPSGVATGVPIILSVFRHDGKLKMWFKQTVAYQSFKIIISFGNKSNTPKPTYSDAPMPTSGVTNKIDIVPKTFLQKSGDTLTGELILHTSGTKFTATSHTWVGGKTTNNALAVVTGINTTGYFPIIRMNHATGNVSNIGVISNKVGFWGYLSSRTENGTDAEAYLDIGTNTFVASKFSGNGASITGVNATKLNGLVETMTNTANTIVKRDGNGDINVRLLRSEYANQSTISGAIAFRTNNSTDNYIRFCSDPAAIRTWLGAAASSHGTHVSYGGNGSATTVSRSDHNHDDRYYTESEINTKLSKKLDLADQITNIDTITGTKLITHKPSSPVGYPTASGSNNAVGVLSINTHPGDYYTQFALDTGSNRLFYRSKNGTSYSWTSWATIYSTLNKPTPADIGAAPSSHKHTMSQITGSQFAFDSGATISSSNSSLINFSSSEANFKYIYAADDIYSNKNITAKSTVRGENYLISGSHRFDGWWMSNSTNTSTTTSGPYVMGISSDCLYFRPYTQNGSAQSNNTVNLGGPSARWKTVYLAAQPNVSSDSRKKQDISYNKDNHEQLETFYDNLKPSSYSMKDGDTGRTHFGFVAQEVEDAMELAGMEYKDCAFLQKTPKDENGEEIQAYTIVEDEDNPGQFKKKFLIENYETDTRIKDYEYALAYSEMISVNTHFIQDLRARVKELETENKSLEDRIERLENLIVNM